MAWDVCDPIFLHRGGQFVVAHAGHREGPSRLCLDRRGDAAHGQLPIDIDMTSSAVQGVFRSQD
jgi:hypothetical protein